MIESLSIERIFTTNYQNCSFSRTGRGPPYPKWRCTAWLNVTIGLGDQSPAKFNPPGNNVEVNIHALLRGLADSQLLDEPWENCKSSSTLSEKYWICVCSLNYEQRLPFLIIFSEYLAVLLNLKEKCKVIILLWGKNTKSFLASSYCRIGKSYDFIKKPLVSFL